MGNNGVGGSGSSKRGSSVFNNGGKGGKTGGKFGNLNEDSIDEDHEGENGDYGGLSSKYRSSLNNI